MVPEGSRLTLFSEQHQEQGPLPGGSSDSDGWEEEEEEVSSFKPSSFILSAGEGWKDFSTPLLQVPPPPASWPAHAPPLLPSMSNTRISSCFCSIAMVNPHTPPPTSPDADSSDKTSALPCPQLVKLPKAGRPRRQGGRASLTRQPSDPVEQASSIRQDREEGCSAWHALAVPAQPVACYLRQKCS